MSDVIQETVNHNVARLTGIDVIEHDTCKLSRKAKNLGTTVVSDILGASVWKNVEIHTDAHVDVHEFIRDRDVPVFDENNVVIALPEPLVWALMVYDPTKHLHTLYKSRNVGKTRRTTETLVKPFYVRVLRRVIRNPFDIVKPALLEMFFEYWTALSTRHGTMQHVKLWHD
jgi:hypothetical protein